MSHALRSLLLEIGLIKVALTLKWYIDRKNLPLSCDHFRLYEVIHKKYFKELGGFPNLKNPESFNDKIQWIKLFDQNPLMIACADKLKVKQYVNDQLGEELYPPVLASGTSAEDISVADLPHQFVLKTNHDSGSVLIVSDKRQQRDEIAAALMTFSRALERRYGGRYGEWAYVHIEPMLFVEAYLGTDASRFAPDYKFHCSQGQVIALQYIFDRQHEASETMLDRNFEPLDYQLYPGLKKSQCVPDLARSVLEKMVVIAEKLAAPFQYVRVDLYYFNEKIYVGELTFFPYMGMYQGSGQKIMGKLMVIDPSIQRPLYSS